MEPSDVQRARGWPAWKRMPAKLLIFLVVVIAVLFPYPRMLLRHVDHVRNMNAMIDPNAPELAGFEAEFRRFEAQREQRGRPAPAARPARGTRVRKDVVTPNAIAASLPTSRPASMPRRASEVQADVQAFVYEKVKYAWDWDIWGMADYMPTVSEMFAKAGDDPDRQMREDCDGRAVMAASLLKRMGYDAMLMTDFGHVWVAVKEGKRQVELMGPGHVKAIVSTKAGNKINVTWDMLKNIPVAVGMGVSVFPWWREGIIFAALVALLWHRRMGRRPAAVGTLLLFAGWHLMRGNHDYWGGQAMPFCMGLAYALIGAGVMMAASRKARRAVASTQT